MQATASWIQRFLMGTSLVSLSICFSAHLAHASDVLATFDPEIHCAHPLAIEDEEALRGVLDNIDDYAVIDDEFRVLCFDRSKVISIKDSTVEIINNSSTPLIIYGLAVKDSKPTPTGLVYVQGDNVIIYDSKIFFPWNNLNSLKERGLVFEGSQYMLIESRVYGFERSVIIHGDNNIVDGGIYDNIKIYGYRNIIRNSLIDGCAARSLLGDGTFYSNRSCASVYKDIGGILAFCPISSLNEHLPGPFTTIANNTIINTRYAVRISNHSERVTVSQNTIPADKNEFRIFDNNHPSLNNTMEPILWHQIGITNAASYKEDGGLRLLGSLDGVAGVIPAHDRIEMFSEEDNDGRFITECPVSINGGPPLTLTDLDGDMKYTIPSNAPYYDCGLLDMGGHDEFSLTYTDAEGSTSPYTRPASIYLDWHFHCAPSYAEFYGTLEITSSSIHDILNNIHSYATDFPSKRVICFPDATYPMGIEPNYREPLIIDNAMKTLVIHNLNLSANHASEIEFEGNEAALTLRGDHITLTGGMIRESPFSKAAPVALRIEGKRHHVSGMSIEAGNTCIELNGYGHTIDHNEIADCPIGIYADCAWPAPEFAQDASCTIGDENYFHENYDITQDYIYLPSTGQNVTIKNNIMEFNISDPLGALDDLTTFEPRANYGIPPIDIEQTGLLDPTSTCMNEIDCTVMGRLDERHCESPTSIEIFITDFDMNKNVFMLKPLVHCTDIFYTTEETTIARYRSRDNPRLVTLYPGDCVFKCTVDWYDVFVTNDPARFAYTITDIWNNTSEYSSIARYYSTLFPFHVFSSSPTPEESEEKFSEEDGEFIVEGEDDASDDGEDGLGADDIIASLPSSLYGPMRCSLTHELGPRSMYTPILIMTAAIIIIILFRRRRCTRHSHIS